MRDTYVPIAYLDTLLNQAQDVGCDVEHLLSKLDLSRAMLKQAKDISARRYGEIYRLIMRETQNEWFGMFSGGHRVPLGSFRMMGLALLQCKDLRQAIFRASDFADICRGMNSRFYLNESKDEASLTMRGVRSVTEREFQSLLDHASPDSVLTAILTWHRFSEWLIDKEIPLRNVSLSFSSEHIQTPLAHTYLTEMDFDSADNGMRFDPSFLDKPIVQNEDSLNAFLRTAPYHLVTQDPAHISPAEKVRSILNRDVSGTMPSAERVASQLNMSVTTLRRQLQREDTSFQKIKDKCRLEAAYHYLSYAELSNNDVAEKLGFDEPSAFFRSFKKWTGLTPGEYRQGLK